MIARPLSPSLLRGFQADPAELPARRAAVPVWMSEAAADLFGWKPGQAIALPLAGRRTTLRIAGVFEYAELRGWLKLVESGSGTEGAPDPS